MRDPMTLPGIKEFIDEHNERCSKDLAYRTHKMWKPTLWNWFRFEEEEQVLRWVHYSQCRWSNSTYYTKWVKNEPYRPSRVVNFNWRDLKPKTEGVAGDDYY